jgi:Tol biopolymer transport system component
VIDVKKCAFIVLLMFGAGCVAPVTREDATRVSAPTPSSTDITALPTQTRSSATSTATHQIRLTPTPTLFPTLAPSATAPDPCTEAVENKLNSLSLAFVAKWNGNPEIYTVSADGTGLKRLTNDSVDDIAPAWSPNGRYIAFISASGSGEQRISSLYLMKPDGTQKTPLVSDRFVYPDFAWSPDSRLIVFSGQEETDTPDLYVIDLASQSLTDLDHAAETGRLGASFPVWSPDSKFVAFQVPLDDALVYWRVNTVAADGSDLQEITSDAVEDRLPQWSPQDKRILFISKSEIGTVPEQLFLMMPNGSARTKLTDSTTFKTLPKWSPNGYMIAYVAYTMTSDAKGKQIISSEGIYLMHVDGTNQTTLVEGQESIEQLSWAPDNRHLAFIQANSGILDLYVADICTSAIKRIAQNVSPYAPSWKPK